MNLSDILKAYREGRLDQAATEAAITGQFFKDLGHSTLDTDRSRRTGNHEVIYGEFKTPAQIADLVTAMEGNQNVLVTRTTAEAYAAVQAVLPDALFHAEARLITCNRNPVPQKSSRVAVVTAGTSDLPVAEEAAITAEFFGSPVLRINGYCS